MGILAIPSRTENWKTAAWFVPLSAEARVRLVDRLPGTRSGLQPRDVQMQLFWRGLRDHFAQCNMKIESKYEALAKRYADRFSGLHGTIEEFVRPGRFRALTDDNYRVATASQKKKQSAMNKRTETAQVSGLTLLIEWAKHRDGWIRKLVADVIAARSELSDQGIADIFELFLREKELAKGELPHVEKLLASQVSASAPQTMQLVCLKHIENVNALASDQEIEFHPRLTVCFGENASGKTGYVRVLKRAAAVRTSQPVLPNIRTGMAGPAPRVTIKIKIGDEEQTIDWQGEQGIEPLTRVDVFDARAAVVHLADDLSYSYTPADLSLFPLVLNGIERVQKELQDAREDRQPRKNPFLIHFQRGNQLYAKIEGLGPSTDKQEIEALAQVSDEEEANLPKLRKNVAALQSDLIRPQIEAINQEKTSLGGVLSIAGTITGFDRDAYGEAIIALRETRANLEQATRQALAGEKIPGILEKAWQDFIKAAEGYIREAGPDPYPSSDAPCIYCRQPLDDAAVELIQKYRDYCNADLHQTVERAAARVQTLCAAVGALSLEATQRDIGRLSSAQEDPGGRQPVITAAMEVIQHGQFLQEAVVAEEDCPSIPEGFSGARSTVRAAAEDAEKTLAHLRSQGEQREKTLAEEQGRLLDLESRLTLRKLMPDIEDHVQAAQWVARCDQNLHAFPVIKRSLTDTAKQASAEVMNRQFQKRFQKECGSLRAPSVTLDFPGREGQIRRRKLLTPKHGLGEILSEGEQKVIALADFLAETSLNPDRSPIVLDDPVTSLDHKRLRYVVDRVFELSQDRQVVVFTHDIWFAAELLDRFDLEPGECWFYEVTSEDQLSGLIERRSHPRTDTFKERNRQIEALIKKAKRETGEKRQAAIKETYGELRGACEIVVEKELLRGAVERYRPNVRMTVLNRIRTDRLPDAIQKVVQIFERCSRNTPSHSHPHVTLGALPTLADLEKDWETLKDARQKYLRD